jgi:hypothetical protein
VSGATGRAAPPPLRCGSFRPGHEPHWIPVLKGAHNTTQPPRPARLLSVRDDGRLDVEIDGAVWHLWNHDAARLAHLCERNHGAVSLQWRWRILRTASDDGHYAFSVATIDDMSPCAPRRRTLGRRRGNDRTPSPQAP